VIGADIANRGKAESEALIGFFVNLVALRIHLDGNPSFDDVLERVRRVTLGAYDHQNLPFDRLVEALRPQRNPLHSVVFQVKIVFHNVPLAELRLPNLRFESIPLGVDSTELDLILHIFDARQGLRAVFEYRKALYEDSTIARFAAHFRLLLSRVLAEPSLDINALRDVLTDADRALSSASRAEQLGLRLDRLKVAKRKGV